ncbi:MAG: hypothetical protein MJD61_10020 [Proteobacteria bacterium]|nr:hypothetical protein [Pseudomonadota bacterium]
MKTKVNIIFKLAPPFLAAIRWLTLCVVTSSCAHLRGAPTCRGTGPQPGDSAALAGRLAGKGLVGRMHGVVPSRRLYVFTYRKPCDFFAYADFPLVAANAAVGTQLASLKRHDKVRLFGSFVRHRAPQRHIRLTAVKVVERHRSSEPRPASYTYRTRLPEDLDGKQTLVGKVHALAEAGRVLVLEWQDAIVPVHVRDRRLTSHLYRNDKVRLRVRLAKHPRRPRHLELEGSAPAAVEVIESIKQGHGEPVTLTGPLVMFPESPQIIFDIYALHTSDADGVTRDYTLLSSKDASIFKAIRSKLARSWSAHRRYSENARNKLINRRLLVTAKGTLNVVSRSQANPQILLESADDVEVRFTGKPGE